MGLDMNLYIEKNAYKRWDSPKRVFDREFRMFEEVERKAKRNLSRMTRCEVGYWSGFYQMDNWIMKNILFGYEDGGVYKVTLEEEDIEKIQEVCDRILNKPEEAYTIFGEDMPAYEEMTEIKKEVFFKNLERMRDVMKRVLLFLKNKVLHEEGCYYEVIYKSSS